ncbi:hypothetical protein ACFLTE_02955 [Bacteroidota bacterium]
MKFDLDNIKKIESYLDGSLLSNELEAFKKELEKNDGLRKEVELHKDIRAGLKRKGRKLLKNELEKYYNEHNKNTSSKKVIRFIVPAISIAASIILFVLIFFKNNDEIENSDDYITLDSVQINKASNYADSATYKSDSAIKINNNQ